MTPDINGVLCLHIHVGKTLIHVERGGREEGEKGGREEGERNEERKKKGEGKEGKERKEE